MIDNIKVLCHSSIVFNKEKVIYVDPFKIDNNYNNADIIFITHDHYDHYSEEDIGKVRKENTFIIIPKSLLIKVQKLGFNQSHIVTVEPNKEYIVEEIRFKTISAYNTNKKFHPKENEWVGYIININRISYYIAGDTDITDENKDIQCDVAFVPVGGIYTMNSKEAAQLVNTINPKIAIPTHYGSVVGKNKDATDFIKFLNPSIKGLILMGK